MTQQNSIKVLTIAKIAPQKIGGFERWLLDITKQLVSDGKSHIVCFEDEPAESVKKEFEAAGASLCYASFDTGFLRQAQLTVRLLKKYRCSIVHLHFYSQIIGAVSLLCWIMRRPLVITYHISGTPSEVGVIKRLAKKLRLFLLGRSIRKVVCVSEYSKNKFLCDYQASETLATVIYNGVRSDSPVSIVDGFKSPSLALAANLIPEKGVQSAIAAMPLILEVFPTAALYIAGDGPFREELETQAEQNGVGGAVEFVGLRSDVPNIFATADIVIVPSIWAEAFGYTVIEGMQAGSPVVASRIGGIPEIIEHGIDGMLVEPGASQEIAESAILLLENEELRQQISTAARLKVQRMFHQDTIIQQYLEVYRHSIPHADING